MQVSVSFTHAVSLHFRWGALFSISLDCKALPQSFHPAKHASAFRHYHPLPGSDDHILTTDSPESQTAHEVPTTSWILVLPNPLSQQAQGQHLTIFPKLCA